MRAIFATGLAALLFTASCSSSEMSTGTAGEARDEAIRITELAVLPVELPTELHGSFTPEEEERYRRDWPMTAANLIAGGVEDQTDKHVRAYASEKQPLKGHYFQLEITYLDIGDRGVRAENMLDGDREGWSLVRARGHIYNAETGELVAELNFEESSGGIRKVPFENDMANMGDQLGEWLDDQR
jgi:hypothetical protein